MLTWGELVWAGRQEALMEGTGTRLALQCHSVWLGEGRSRSIPWEGKPQKHAFGYEVLQWEE